MQTQDSNFINRGRRGFLPQSLAFSAVAALGSSFSAAAPLLSGPSSADLLMIGDGDTMTTT